MVNWSIRISSSISVGLGLAISYTVVLSPVTSIGGRNPKASSNAASIDIVIGIMNELFET